MIRRRGFTIIELVVASVILGFLLFMAFLAYQLSASSLMKGTTQAEMLGTLQVAFNKIEGAVKSSSRDGVSTSLDQTVLATIQATDLDGKYTLDSTGRLEWQGYRVFYWTNDDDGILYTRKVSYPGGPTTTASSLESSSGSDLLSFRNNGTPLARGLSDCRFYIDPSDLLVLEATIEKKRYGSEEPERISARSTVAVRN